MAELVCFALLVMACAAISHVNSRAHGDGP